MMIELADNITVGYASEGGKLESLLKTNEKKQIKTLQRIGDTDRKENETNDKFNMKVQFDSNPQTDKNRQCITCFTFHFNLSKKNMLITEMIMYSLDN